MPLEAAMGKGDDATGTGEQWDAEGVVAEVDGEESVGDVADEDREEDEEEEWEWEWEREGEKETILG